MAKQASKHAKPESFQTVAASPPYETCSQFTKLNQSEPNRSSSAHSHMNANQKPKDEKEKMISYDIGLTTYALMIRGEQHIQL